MTARVGEAILIPKGARVTYRGRAGTLGFFVLWPFDWDKKEPAGDQAPTGSSGTSEAS